MSGLQPPLSRSADAARRLQDYMHAHIPLVTQMQVAVASLDAAGLRLTAPLAPNINHERTAFGGSLASLMTLACWGYLWLQLEGESRLHIVVNEAKLSYLKPVTGELAALCPPPAAAELERFRETLARRGKARIELGAEVRQGQAVAARYVGSFAVYRET
ncbi:MAG TPA: YiiD C-terminal domain-containing protein [Gammaproteobacteria bacterium]|jgi:thioesterase domain-containing protein